MSLISSDISLAKAFLQAGKLVAIPTETVYGLAGNALDENVIRSIFELKQRPFFNPLIAHIGHLDQVQDLAREVPDLAWKFAEACWPGPLTMVLPKKAHVPDLLTAGQDTVAIRLPQHALCRALLQSLDFPLAAPSANPFQQISPTTAAHVAGYFGETLPMILDGGPCQQGIESSIIGFEGTEVLVYRLGSMALERLSAIHPKLRLVKAHAKVQTPGMAALHYAPKTPMRLCEDLSQSAGQYDHIRLGALWFGHGPAPALPNVHWEILSTQADEAEAMQALYAAMHRLDALKLDLLLAPIFPPSGLGLSLNDRLQRAAAGS